MDKKIEQAVDFSKIKSIQNAFDDSMKILEKSIAESITDRQKLKKMKEDMLAASKKFNEAEETIDSLKIKLKKLK